MGWFFALALGASGSITEGGSGMVYGRYGAFNLTAPKGWMLDNESAVDQGIHAVFYPKGSNWADGAVVVYAQARPKEGKIQTPDDVAKNTVATFRADGSPKYDGKRVKVLKTEGGTEAVIYHFEGDQWGNHEAVAYFPEAKAINFLVLTARNGKDFKDALPAFEELVKSYVFLSDKPVKPKEAGAKKS